MKHIRNGLYGDITVSDDELQIIGSPSLQRLRRVHQLGLTSTVYPGATHSRFEHSLGVMYLAGKMAESIGLDEERVQAYRFAGLLHDTGHAPFSHATESVMEERLGIQHEERSCRIVKRFEDELPVPADTVQDIINGDSEYDIVAGDVDVDRMDYLQRDSSETGLNIGNIDSESIITFAESHNGELAFSKKGIQALEGLFSARLRMTKSVYAHHTSKITEKMLERAVESFLDETETRPEELLSWDDHQLHTRLLDFEGLDDLYMGVADPTSSEETNVNALYGRVATRNIYKRALFCGVHDIGKEMLREISDCIDNPRDIESSIAEIAGVSPSTVLIDPPILPKQPDVDVNVLVNNESRPFSEMSPIPSHLEDAQWRNTIIGVYAPKEHREIVGEAARQVLDIPITSK